MHRELFLMIVEDVTNHDKYFVRKKNAVGQLGLYPIQKVASAIQMLAYGGAADANDEYIQISESTTLESLDRFCDAVIHLYSKEYLRYPTKNDLERLLAVGKARGFPGMLGSLDCMHWEWKNCPTAWAGQYTGKEKVSLRFFFLLCWMGAILIQKVILYFRVLP